MTHSAARKPENVRHCVRCGRATEASTCPDDKALTILDQARFRDQLEIGVLVDDRYEISGKIAAGSYGSVYSARHLRTGHAVALKVMDPLPGDDLVTTARRFFREAAATARLSHPNTVRVFDFGQTDYGELYIAMELLKGRSVAYRLQQTVRRGRVMTPRMVGMIGVGVLRSLGEAHAAGLVHRDLKPENVILHEAGPADLAVKVVDFGVARDLAAPMTRPGTVIGTASHMSPEQVTGTDVDHRSDLYCVGVMLYECLTGTLPFEGENTYVMAMAHVLEDPPSVGERLPALAGTPLERVVMKALNKKPGKRWQSALEMRVALLEAVGHEDLFMLDDAFESSMYPVGTPLRDDLQDKSLPPDQRPTAQDLGNARESAPIPPPRPQRIPTAPTATREPTRRLTKPAFKPKSS